MTTPLRVTPALHVGCPMWANRKWVGRHLPADTPVGGELGAYRRLLNAVEGNTTFYALPRAELVGRWADQLSAGSGPFRLVLKAPRAVTHERRLRDVDRLLDSFVELMSPLGGHLGGVMLQLPPTFGPGDLDALDRTAARLSAAVRWSVEVRHHEFCGGPGFAALHRLLEAHGVERVVLDTTVLFSRPPRTAEGRDEWRTKPRLPLLDVALTDRPVVRYVGGDEPDRTSAGLDRWTEVLATWVHDGRSPTFFVHTPDNLDSPALARQLHADVVAAMPSVAPLAPPPEISSPGQTALF